MGLICQIYFSLLAVLISTSPSGSQNWSTFERCSNTSSYCFYHLYQINSNVYTKEAAANACTETEGGFLMELWNSDLTEQLKDFIRQLDAANVTFIRPTKFFINAKKLPANNSWKWIIDGNLTETNRLSENVTGLSRNLTSPYAFVRKTKSDVTYHAGSINETKFLICKYQSPNCIGSTAIGSYCYTAYFDKRTWKEAYKTCNPPSALGLPTLNNQEESTNFQTFMKNLEISGNSGDFWIGLTKNYPTWKTTGELISDDFMKWNSDDSSLETAEEFLLKRDTITLEPYVGGKLAYGIICMRGVTQTTQKLTSSTSLYSTITLPPSSSSLSSNSFPLSSLSSPISSSSTSLSSTTTPSSSLFSSLSSDSFPPLLISPPILPSPSSTTSSMTSSAGYVSVSISSSTATSSVYETSLSETKIIIIAVLLAAALGALIAVITVIVIRRLRRRKTMLEEEHAWADFSFEERISPRSSLTFVNLYEEIETESTPGGNSSTNERFGRSSSISSLVLNSITANVVAVTSSASLLTGATANITQSSVTHPTNLASSKLSSATTSSTTCASTITVPFYENVVDGPRDTARLSSDAESGFIEYARIHKRSVDGGDNDDDDVENDDGDDGDDYDDNDGDDEVEDDDENDDDENHDNARKQESATRKRAVLK